LGSGAALSIESIGSGRSFLSAAGGGRFIAVWRVAGALCAWRLLQRLYGTAAGGRMITIDATESAAALTDTGARCLAERSSWVVRASLIAC